MKRITTILLTISVLTLGVGGTLHAAEEAPIKALLITGDDVVMIDNGQALDLSITSFLPAIGSSADP